MPAQAPASLEILPVAGLPEFRPGDDLAGLLCRAAPWLRDGDVLVITSKAVSKVEGRLVVAPTDPAGRDRARQEAIVAQTSRVVAQRGPTSIVVTPQGWVMAAAGVDASNVASGEIALLPVDSDASALALRSEVLARTGISIAVVVSDTNGRAWRRGLTDVAIGVSGMAALLDLRGATDASGVPLEVTEIALADEIAAAADLAKGKLSRIPAAVIRGLAVPPDDGQGARALRRPIAEDMFHLGTRDVVRTRRAPGGFGAGPVPISTLRSAIEVALASAEAIGTDSGFQLLPEDIGRGPRPGMSTQAAQLVSQAAALIVPFLADAADGVAVTRLGMAICALLIQLHAEGLAATWLTPGDVGHVVGSATALTAGRPHGLVVVGQNDR